MQKLVSKSLYDRQSRHDKVAFPWLIEDPFFVQMYLRQFDDFIIETTVDYRYPAVWVAIRGLTNDPESIEEFKNDSEMLSMIKPLEFHVLEPDDYLRRQQYGFILQSKDHCGFRFDTQRIRSLLEHCRAEHGHEVPIAQDEDLKVILIDVTQGNLVDSDVSSEYLALSYVWGSGANFKTLRRNLGRLRRPDVLLKEANVARVILDAMTIVKALGYQYLWVAALCIIQDDPSKAYYIERMNSIYSSAICTIIAASGTSADQPIPRVQLGSRTPVNSCSQDGYSLLRAHFEDAQHAFMRAPSETRGWTLQERLVSPRLLVFMTDRVFLTCALGTHEECPSYLPKPRHNSYSLEYHPTLNIFHGIHVFDPDFYWTDVKFAEDNSSPDSFQLMFAYHDLVNIYTKRVLTREDDIYNAFRGIEN